MQYKSKDGRSFSLSEIIYLDFLDNIQGEIHEPQFLAYM